MFIDTYMTLPVNCPARRYSEMLHAGDVSREFLLDMEMFMAQISEHCHERWMFRRLYEDHRIRAGVESACRNDPTTQEMDRQACKKTSVRIAGWFQNARQKLGRIKALAIFR